jgi:translocation and assembly module TamB
VDDALGARRPVPDSCHDQQRLTLTARRRGPARRFTGWGGLAVWTALALASAAVFGAVFWHRYAASGLLAGDVRLAVVRNLEAGLGRQASLGSVSGDLVGGITLRDLRIAEQGGFDRGVAASVEEIHLSFNWRSLFGFPPDIVGTVARAELVGPHLALSRSAAGTWNIASLLTAQGAPAPGRFRGRITIREGSLTLTDAFDVPHPPFVAHFTHIVGEADARRGDPVSIALTGQSPEGGRVTLGGQYHPRGGTSGFDFAVTDAAAAHWGGYLIPLRELEWERGRFGGSVHVSLTQTSSDVSLDFAATLRLHDADVLYRPAHLWFRHVSGPITVDTAHAETPGLTLQANSSPLVIDGTLVFGGNPWVELGLKSPALDLAIVQGLFFPRAPLTITGQAGADVRITGPVKAPDIDGQVTAGRGRLNRQAFDGLHTRIQYGAGTLSLTHLRAGVDGGRLAGDLVLNVSDGTPRYLFTGTTSNVDVRTLASAGLSGLTAITGRVSGQMVGVGTGSRVQLMGDVTMGRGSVSGLAFNGLHTIFWHDGAGAMDLDYLSATIGTGTLYSSGHIGANGVLDLDVLAQDLSLADIGARAGMRGMPLDGRATLEGRATGTTASPVFSGTVTASHGRLGPLVFAHAQGPLRLSPSGLVTEDLELLNGMARYRVSGALTFQPLAAVNLHLDAADIDAQMFTNATSLGWDATGTLTANLTVNGPVAHPSIEGQVSLEHGSVSGQRVDHAEARLVPDGGRIHIAEAEVRLNGSRLFASGTIDPSGPVDLRIWAEDLRIADMDAALGLGLPVRGTLALTGDINGTFRDPILLAEIRSRDFAVRGQTFDVSGAMEYEHGTLRLTSLQLAQGAAHYQLSGEIRLGARPSAGLSLDIDHGRLATILAAGGLRLPATLDGTIDGRVEFSGPLDDPSARLSLTVQDASFGAYAIGRGAADLTLTHQAIDIERFEIHPAQGQVAAKGRVDLRGTSAVEFSAQGLNPDFLRPFFPSNQPFLDRPFEGSLTFTVQLSGPTQAPTAGLSFEALDIGVPGALADRIAGLAYYSNGVLHIEQGVISKGPHKAVVQGTLPIDPRTLALDPASPMQLQIRLQDADLSLLSLVTPKITDASGTVAGEVNVAGTVAAPQMAGFLRSAGGRMRVAGLRTPIENMNIDLSFSQDAIQVRDISADLGKGRVTTTGTVEIANFRPRNIELALLAEHADLDLPGLYSGQVDSTLHIRGTAALPTLSGNIALSHGFVAPGGAGGPAGGWSALGLDLTVQAGSDVVFTLGAVRADVAGTLHIGGTLGHPLLSGRVTSEGGEVAFLGSTFRLTSGEAVFSESLGVEPQIIARAQQVYGETIVFLDISGMASHPELTLTSDPPLTQAELVTLVARNAGIFGDPGSVFSQGLGRYLLGSLREALHLSEFSVSYTRASPITLRIGKFLLRNLYLSLSEVLAGPPGTTMPPPGTPLTPATVPRQNPSGQAYSVGGLEYFLSPSVLLTYNVDTLGGNGVFLLTRFPF